MRVWCRFTGWLVSILGLVLFLWGGLALTQVITPIPNPNVDYTKPNWGNSPPLHKFVDSLPGVGASHANNLGEFIPLAVPDTTTYPGDDYYQIALTEYHQQMHSDLPVAGTRLRGYADLNGDSQSHYLGPIIVAQRDRPVRIKFSNMLTPNSNFFLPVDTTVMGAGLGPSGAGGGNYSVNRATLHLHGGATPWISDGTPHQWITPSGETTSYPTGLSLQNVPDMPAPATGEATFFYTNQQSARLMFYHDHAYGITRLDVYAGEAAGYLLTDTVEEDLISTQHVIPDLGPILGAEYHLGVPLILQDKTFVSTDPTVGTAITDPLWPTVVTGAVEGDLWFPHVYMPNQAFNGGVNMKGRWDYGPLVAPTASVQNPMLPTTSIVPEAFHDTPIVNGTAYPYLVVEPTAYRFRILNACNDRYLNLQLYYVDPANPTEVKMVPADGSTIVGPYGPVVVPADGRDGGVPDPTTAGPPIIQIGNEGGLLPQVVVLNAPPAPIDYDYDRRSVTFGNVRNFPIPNYPQVGYTLFLGPAERADVIIDFSQIPLGSKLILYNDAPAPNPGFDARVDYYIGDPDFSVTGTDMGGAPTTQIGFGPNTRTFMQFIVDPAGTPTAQFNLTALQAALPTAFQASQPAPIIPDGVDPRTPGSAVYGQISSPFVNGMPAHFKSISEDFDPMYGRMNARLGANTTTISTQGVPTYGKYYIDPVTEISPVDGSGAGDAQVWRIDHYGVDTHAIHFHLFNVQVINRMDVVGVIKPPDPNEMGWKETVKMNPLEAVFIALKPSEPTLPFTIPTSQRPLDVTMPSTGALGSVYDPVTNPNPVTDYGWEYVWHCHLLGHEENDMMRPFVLQVPGLAPSAPTGLTANVQSSGSSTVTLNWTDNSNNESGFRVERATVTGGVIGSYSPVPPGTVSDIETFVDTVPAQGQEYAYRIFAFNVIGDSAASNVVTITPGLAPIATTCTANTDCASGFCVDSLCCDTACGGGDPNDCVACSIAAGGSANGTCTAFADHTLCDDGLYCNGYDTCLAGICAVHYGNPCTDSDQICDETLKQCVESGDDDSAADDDSGADDDITDDDTTTDDDVTDDDVADDDTTDDDIAAPGNNSGGGGGCGC